MATFLIENKCCDKNNDKNSKDKKDKQGQRCCISEWDNKLKSVTNDYNTSQADTTLGYKKYINALNWEEQLRVWKTNISTVDQKAKAVSNIFTFFISQVDIVCENSHNSTNSIKKLALLLKRVFDAFHTYEKDKLGFMDTLKKLKNDIACLHHCNKEDKESAIQQVINLENKFKAVLEVQEATLKSILKTLKCAYDLTNSICEKQGLKAKLQGMEVDFNGKPVPTELEAQNTKSDAPEAKPITNPEKAVKGKYPEDPNYPATNENIRLKPSFPISENKYYTDLTHELTVAQVKTIDLEGAWKEKKKISDGNLSKKESLIEAIKAAEAAKGPKN